MPDATMFPIKDVDQVGLAFPTSTRDYMPAYADIPAEFKSWNDTRWEVRLFNDMFYSGLKSLDLKPKPGVDKDRALRHIRYVMGSWEPQHEHKTAGVAYLFNQWFDGATWVKREKEPT